MNDAILQFGGSLVAILSLAGIAYWMKLGGTPKIDSEDQARALASEVNYGFKPVGCAVDLDGAGAVLVDRDGRIMLLKRHGSHFAGRILANGASATMVENRLSISTGEQRFGKVSLNLSDGEIWARRIEEVKVASHA